MAANSPEDRRKVVETLCKTILEKLPAGFEETMAYGMISYVVPKTIYPSGYHLNPKEPLPYIKRCCTTVSGENKLEDTHLYPPWNPSTFFCQ
ncbi:DUF1801 domain-containing protein [Clostridium thermarum]|uniref:DUF1801 domain-containing protein n=1 Tax=Clostridium thermarum TaxID=1716543 RepID=UPI0013D573B9|nr:DUF1801 domain-containing protein [Clostridium thermarum]